MNEPPVYPNWVLKAEDGMPVVRVVKPYPAHPNLVLVEMLAEGRVWHPVAAFDPADFIDAR
jgi:hypothetical protein